MIWAVTSYFNPSGFRVKHANYQVFRKHLSVPLLTVEHSVEGRFELDPVRDADRLLQVRGGDIMWQKERLLNWAVEHLPAACQYVAWLDCDIVFEHRDTWPEQAIRKIRGSGNLCQLYRRVCHLRPGTGEDQIHPGSSYLEHTSFGWAIQLGLETPVVAVTEGRPSVKRGHAWCAPAELLRTHGLYDRNVIGSGDRLLAHAITGQQQELIVHDGMAPRHAADYLRWADRFRPAAGRVSVLDGDLFHLWHGDLEDRHYQARHRILLDHDFDPDTDIALHPSGCWRWNSEKPEMHRRIREYFDGRREDR